MKQATLCLLIRDQNLATTSEVPAEGRRAVGGSESHSLRSRAPNQKDKEILLAMKKRGFGKGKWNGIGGKLAPEKGDRNIIDTVVRETEEEIGVKIKEFEKTAVLSFYFPYICKKEWDQDVHVFLAKKWEGKPTESEEMLPKWFKIEEIPFAKMWDDDRFWLPLVLDGKKLKAKFVFKEGEKISKKNIKLLENLK